MISTATQRPIAFALALGLLGGSALITIAWNTTRGPVVLIAYAMLIIVAAVYLRVERVQHFSRRFSITLGAFMFATLMFYLFIGLVAAKTLFKIPLFGHAWRLGFMLLVGSALSAAVAQMTATRTQQ
jgi:hypothetical protein